MNEQTVSATFSMEQINEILITVPVYYSWPRPNVKLIFETETIALDPNNPMFWLVIPDWETEAGLKAEFDAWEAASDDDLANFEANL